MKKIAIVAVVALMSALVLAPIVGADDAAGKTLYDKKCAMCHGKDGVAKKMATGSADLNDPEWQEKTTVEDIITVTSGGKGKMPKSEGKLTPEEIQQISEYVKTL